MLNKAVYKNVKPGKINKSRRKDYLMMFKKYVTRNMVLENNGRISVRR